jgi:3,4-dihydroxy-2-butanone 4-phosphate synthase
MQPQRSHPDVINFMATHGRGLICLALTPERCDQLRLPLMSRPTRRISGPHSVKRSTRATA